MKKLWITLLFLPMIAWGSGREEPPPEPEPVPFQQEQQQDQTQDQYQDQTQDQYQDQVQDQMQDQQNQQEQQQSQDTDQQNSQSLNFNSNYKGNAPSLTIYAPPSTARFMTCIGLGGSNEDGAATGIWCRIQRDLYAEHRSERLAEMGAWKESAEAYCNRKLHWKDFGSKSGCLTSYQDYIKNRVITPPIQPPPPVIVNVLPPTVQPYEVRGCIKGDVLDGKDTRTEIECYEVD